MMPITAEKYLRDQLLIDRKADTLNDLPKNYKQQIKNGNNNIYSNTHEDYCNPMQAVPTHEMTP